MQTSINFIMLISLALSLVGCSVVSKKNYYAHRAEPQNLDDYKARLANYYKFEYAKQVKDLLRFAKQKIKQAVQDDKKTVVLFDFADVLYSSWTYQQRFQFGFNYESWKAWVDEAEAENVPGVVEFYRWCEAQKVDVKIVSGRRREEERVEDEPSVINLPKIGITNYDIIWIRPEEAPDRGAFKRRVRQELRSQGYELIVNLGSQERDFAEESDTIHIKLPNPFYRAPSRIQF